MLYDSHAQNAKAIFVYGFALFAMFFGSGNLVFPIKIGTMSGEYWYWGFLGLFFTGILLPFMGLFVIKLRHGKYLDFFAEAGPVTKILVPFVTLSFMGSFGAFPRCITVAFGGISYATDEFPLWIFSAVFCVLTYFFCVKDERMFDSIGKWMSPILLVVLVFLIGAGILGAESLPQSSDISIKSAFTDGFVTGYQTMDLFAAFFFSALIFVQIQKAVPEDTPALKVVKFAIKPSILGAALLALIYVGFVFLGASYPGLLGHQSPEHFLPAIAFHVLGNKATTFVVIAMVFSCLTTAVALNNIYARYLCNLFRLDESKFPLMLLGTTLIAFLISLLDFNGIARFLVPALEITYPGIIMLTILGLFTKGWQRFKTYAFYALTMLMIVKILFF